MKTEMARLLVIGLLLVQVVVVAMLWLLEAFSIEATAAFALLLAGDAMAFAVVVHIYRTAGD
jgi:hypothetical protein